MPDEKGVITLEIGPNVKDVLMSLILTLLKTDDPVEHAIGDGTSFNGQSCPKCEGALFETKTGIHCVNGDFTPPTDAELTDIAVAVVNDADADVAFVETAAAAVFNAIAPDLPPPPPPPAADTTVKLADGIPHDIRIHASTQTVYAKAPHGWKLKRGVDPALVETVTAELRAAMSIPTPGLDDAAAGNVPAPTATEKMMAAYKEGFDGRDAAAGNVLPPPPTEKMMAAYKEGFDGRATLTDAVAPPPPPPPPPKRVITEDIKAVQRIAASGQAAPITTFAEFVAAMTPALASGQLTQATIDAELAAIGLQSIPLLGARQDLIPVLAAKLFPGV